MIGLWVSLLAVMLVLPEWASAADLGLFGDFSGLGTGIISLGYIFGGGGVVWSGYRTTTAYNHRDENGMRPVLYAGGATLAGAVMVGKVIPSYVAPIIASGATPW